MKNNTAKDDLKMMPVELNSDGVLAFMWRRILTATNGMGKVRQLVKETADREYKMSDGMTIAQASKKENEIRNYATAGKLSWDKFLMLVFKVRRCKDVSITIQFKLPNDETNYVIQQEISTDVSDDEVTNDEEQQNNNNEVKENSEGDSIQDIKE